MSIEDIANSDEFRSLVEDYRDTCLWFMKDAFHPKDARQLECILSSIESYGDMAAYKKAGRIRQWQ
ncbi:MAG: hypothetical protein IJQ34_05695 [Kiritimatiellae bacterium]|nr:hypothetical protein [Kiritimatiellia bacterium]